MWLKWLPWTAAFWLLSSCTYPVQEQTDLSVCQMASHPLDLAPPTPVDQSVSPINPAGYSSNADQADSRSESQPNKDAGGSTQEEPNLPQPKPLENDGKRRRAVLQIPPGLPGANAPPIRWPENPAEREAYLKKLYPALPPLGPNPVAIPGPNGRPLTLSDLQQLALTNSPVIRQAASDVEAAKGAAIQAGAYPNPNFGYQWDTAGTGGTAGFQGAFLEQTIRTGSKLKLAQASAVMDLLNAQVALRRAQADLANQVRSGYFAVLVALESIRVNQALVRLTDEAFRIQVEQVRIVAAPYEPMQLRVLAFQARDALVQARNTYTGAWKQLATTLGLPGMPPTQLAGRVDMPIPIYSYATALAQVLSTHTDVLTAANGIQRARYNLALANATPLPDVSLHLAVEHDFTVPPFITTTSGTIGVPLPLWDRNKGNIIQAQAALLRAMEQPHAVRDNLTSQLADAFRRYDSNRLRLELYRDQILPDQVRAYRGIRLRYDADPDSVAFADVVTAQQTLAMLITTYVGALGDFWTAVDDVANLLQTNDLYQVGGNMVPTKGIAPVPDLEHLLPLPDCHPCSTLANPSLKKGDGSWPPALPPWKESPAPSAASPGKQVTFSGLDDALEDSLEVLPVSPAGSWKKLPR
ncbi:MAG: TolC family protein [Planctomycetes bacterium]|nr:TolC family protein [Planctomycetota bacterium]